MRRTSKGRALGYRNEPASKNWLTRTKQKINHFHSTFLSSLEFPAQPGREASKSSKGEIINLPHRAYHHHHHHHLQHHLHLICLCLEGSEVGEEVEEVEGGGGKGARRDPQLIRDTRRGGG